jgi:hypothetical protein
MTFPIISNVSEDIPFGVICILNCTSGLRECLLLISIYRAREDNMTSSQLKLKFL